MVWVALAVPAAQPMEVLTEYLDMTEKEAIQVIAVLMEQLLLALRMEEAAALVLLE